MGVVITSQMYEKGEYTRRESVIIATSFSVSGISFALTMAQYVGLEAYFPHYYLTGILCGIVCAVITSRIPPLSTFPDTYYEDKRPTDHASRPKDTGIFSWAVRKGCEHAEKSGSFDFYFKKGVAGLLSYWFVLMSVVLSVGTIGLILVHYTPVFTFLSLPFKWVLTALRVPEAAAAAPAMITGFIDYFINLPIANQIDNMLTRFVILCMSFIQCIYLTQAGALILKSKMKVNVAQLFVIFIERTIISLPIVVMVGHLLF